MPTNVSEWFLFIIFLLLVVCFIVWMVRDVTEDKRAERKRERERKRKIADEKMMLELENSSNSLKSLSTWGETYTATSTKKSNLKIVSDIIDEQNLKDRGMVYVSKNSCETSDMRNGKFYKAVLRKLLEYMPSEIALDLINNRLCYDIEQDMSETIEFFEFETSVFRGTKAVSLIYAKGRFHQEMYSTKGNGIYFVQPTEERLAKMQKEEEPKPKTKKQPKKEEPKGELQK